nr:TPA_asm: hypothetical protein HUJ06_010054 [Nelumbo nucifera]
MKLKQDEGLIRQNKEKLGKILDVYERRLGEIRFPAGDDFTLADLTLMANYVAQATTLSGNDSDERNE